MAPMRLLGKITRVLGGLLRDTSLAPAVSGHDHVLGRHVDWALGPQVDATGVGMGGVGGSFGEHFVQPGVCVGFTTADLSPPERMQDLDAAWDALAG